MLDYIVAGNKEEYAAAAVLFQEYAAWLGIDLSFQNFEEELQELHNMYAAPQGSLLLVKDGETFIGCVAVRKKEYGIAELKRMYVQPAYRKAGVAARLLVLAEDFAARAGYETMKLDTLSSMLPAMAFYRKHGYTETTAYYHNPNENTVYFEKKL